jgi:predicted amidophosphoribosyltransferase
MFPKKCKICLKDLDSGFLCKNCEQDFRTKLKLKFINPKNNLDGLFYLIDLNPKVRKILHLGKYRFAKEVWKFFGNIMKVEFKHKNLTVTYVPMNWFRFCFRGFNQSYMLAKYIGRPIKLVYKNWLVHSVTNLNKKDRAKELEKAFIINNIPKENILIVDDV